jgi:hypothetical protein
MGRYLDLFDRLGDLDDTSERLTTKTTETTKPDYKANLGSYCATGDHHRSFMSSMSYPRTRSEADQSLAAEPDHGPAPSTAQSHQPNPATAAEAPPEMLDGIAVGVGLHIPLIPRQPKRGLGNRVAADFRRNAGSHGASADHSPGIRLAHGLVG